MNQDQPKNIAVFIPNWVGDAVMATPALRALRAGCPDAVITLIGRPAPLAVLDGAHVADAVLADNSRGLVGMLRLARRLRKRRFDLAILLPNSFRSALAAKLGRCTRRLGYARDGRHLLLTDRLDPPREQGGKLRVYPAIDYYCDLVASLGLSIAGRQMVLGLTPEGEAGAKELLAGVPEQRWVMLNPGGAFGPSKRWSAERYAELADRLVKACGVGIIINAAPNEKAIAREVANAMAQPPALNLAEVGNSIDLLKSVMSRCEVLVTNDTGARHIGAGLGVGVVTIFGSTDPKWTPIGYARERRVVTTSECAPCQQKVCPHDKGDARFGVCLTSITTDTVFAAATELLAPGHGGQG
jgi:heptosyltransferase II